MINVSDSFKLKTKKIKHQHIKLGILGGELTVKEVNFMTVKQFNALPVWLLRKRKEVIAKELRYSFEGSLFKTIMKQIEITVKNAGELKDKNVNFQYGLYVNNDYEYIDLGDYYIKDIEDDKGKKELVVTGYDKMINFMKTFKQSDLQLTYPCTMLALIQKMCEVCGVELYSTDFFHSDLQVDEDYFTAQELTYRDVLEKVAQSTLTTIFIKDNKLYLHKLANTSVEKMDTSFLSGLTIKEKFGPLNALVLGRGSVEDNIEAKDDISIAKNGRCEIRFDENEFVEYQREQVINKMFEQIKGLEYYAFESSDLGVMWLEPCDLIELEDSENNIYQTIYLKANITINTGISSDIEADIPKETNTEYKVTTKEEKKTLKVERLAKKNEGLIQDLVQETTETGKKLTQVEQTVDGITQTVSSVETKVETVENKAEQAQTSADNAQSTADEAISKITTTTNKVSEIEQTVDNITSTVSSVETKVEQVENKADIANSNAQKAQSSADTAQSTAENAQTTANNINNNLTQNYYTKTETNSQIQQTADTINQTVQQTIDKTNEISGEVEQQSSKLTEIEQSLDGISQRVETIQDVTQTVEGTKTITLANCVEGDLLELHIYGNNSVFKYLYPADDLFPSDTLYPYGDSRVVVADENNNSKTYELGVTDTLRKNGNICDEYILEGGKAKVIRRINKNGTIKSTETVENLGEYSIRLKNGTNKITIKNYTATIKAKYAIQNDYTEIFSTKVETKTAIKQTAEDIDISVNKKFESYSTTTEMNSAINLKANEINQKVEKKVDEETITGAYLVLKINEDKSESKLNADKIDISANDVLNILSGNTINLKTKNIKIESNNFSVDENGNIVAKSGTIGGWTVNSEAIFNGKGLGQEGSVGISCKIDDWAFWAGNGVFKVSPSGALTATNATITGKITASSGSIGGAQINAQGLYFNNDSESTGWGLWGTTANANIVMHAGAKSNNIGGAPFKIYHDGSVYMTKGQISGNLITSGINASNITGGSLSMSRIKGGTLDVKCDEGYLRVGVGYKHPTVSGLNVRSNGINVNDGRLIITSGGNWSYIRSSYGLDNIRLLDSNGANIPCGRR